MAYKSGRFKGKTAREAHQINLDRLKKVLPPNVVKKMNELEERIKKLEQA